jgi:hypothetical protein
VSCIRCIFKLVNVKITLSVSHIEYRSTFTHVSGCLLLLHVFYCIPTTLGAAKCNSEFLENLLCMLSSFVCDSRRISPEICTFCSRGLISECHRLSVCVGVKTCVTVFRTSWERRMGSISCLWKTVCYHYC